MAAGNTSVGSRPKRKDRLHPFDFNGFQRSTVGTKVGGSGVSVDRIALGLDLGFAAFLV